MFTSYTGENNRCNYRIKLPGVNYQVGVIRQKEGHYALSHDPFGYEGGGRHDGHKLAAFGENLGRLCQTYTAQVLKASAKIKGWTCVQKTLPSGKLQLQMMKL